jgi:glycosyl transferase family 87
VPRVRWSAAVVVASVAFAALSLLVLYIPAYDPTGWLIWGRELSDGTLNTLGGPSWKPLPVVVTTPLALAGDDVAPLLWLVVTRVSGVVALTLTYVLARRLGGRWAGVAATLGLVLASGFVWNFLRGDSEGLLVALGLGAVLLYLDGRPRAAFALAVLAGGLRPEVWPLLALYGAWLVWRDRRPATAALVAGAGLALLAAWFLPDRITTGDWLQSAHRALLPVEDTPAQAAFPFGATFADASEFLPWPLYAAALVAVVAAWRGRHRTTEDRTVLALAAGAVGLITIVALLAEVGFTGNIRYTTLPGALLAVVGGVGLAALLQRAPVPVRVVVAAAVIIGAVSPLNYVRERIDKLEYEQRIMGDGLDRALTAAGGPAAIRACGPVATTMLERQRLAYRLEISASTVSTHAIESGIFFLRRDKTMPRLDLPVRAVTPDWVVRARC